MLPKHTNQIPRIFVPSYILAKDGDYSLEGFRNRKDSGYYREVILHDIIKPSESQPNISFLIEDVNEDPLGRYVEGVYNFNPFDQKYAPNRLQNPLMNIIICDATQYFYNNINKSFRNKVLVEDKNGNYFDHGNGRTNVETNCYIVPLIKYTNNSRIVINSIVYNFLKGVVAQNKTARHFYQGTKTLFSEQNVPDEVGRHIGSFTGINDTLYKKLLDEDAAKAAKAKAEAEAEAEATAASKGGKRKSRKQKKTRKTRRNH